MATSLLLYGIEKYQSVYSEVLELIIKNLLYINSKQCYHQKPSETFHGSFPLD